MHASNGRWRRKQLVDRVISRDALAVMVRGTPALRCLNYRARAREAIS
jgi:hypothetical protein